MSELWHKNREIRASKINLGTNKDVFDLTGTTHYKSTFSINSKAASHTSSHCAMIHVPPLPLLDVTTNYSGIQCDVVIRGSFEMDYTCPKDVTDHSSAHALGEIWDDTVDPATCPYGGYGIMEYAKSRGQFPTMTGFQQ